MEWGTEKEKLIKLLLEEKLSYSEIGRRYGYTGNGIKKVCKRLQIPLEPKRSINPSESFNQGKSQVRSCLQCGQKFTIHPKQNTKYCSKRCEGEYKSLLKYKEYLLHPELYAQVRNMRWVKKYILKEQNNRCSICKCSNIWNHRPLVFVLDHINGRASDNSRNNLRCICPNCDSQLDTFKSKNKNSDRIYHRKYHR